MRAVAPEWKAAMSRRGVETRRMVVIYLDGAAVRSFITGPSALFGAQPSILSVSSHSASIDPWTCAVSVGERSIRLKLDPSVRDLVANNHLEGRRVEIFLGAVGLDFSHWPREWVGQILDTPVAADNSVTMRAGDVFSFLRDRQIAINVTSEHPLEAIVEILETCAVPQELWDADSFDYLREDLRGLSHLVISRSGRRGYFQDAAIDPPTVNAWTAIQDLFGVLNAAPTFDIEGRLVFNRFDATKATSRVWSAEQISGFRMESAVANRHDEISVEFLKSGARSSYVAADATSATEHVFSGLDPRPKPKTIGSDWLNGIVLHQGARLQAPYVGAPPDDTEVTLFGVDQGGISGLRHPSGQAPVDVPSVDSEAPTYIRIGSEIMRVDGVLGTMNVLGYTGVRVAITRGASGTAKVGHGTILPAIGDRVGTAPEDFEWSGMGFDVAEIDEDPYNRYAIGFYDPSTGAELMAPRAFFITETEQTLLSTMPVMTAEQKLEAQGSTYRIYQRPDFDTTPGAGTWFEDITIPMLMAKDRERFIHGVPIVEVRVPLTEYDVGLSDFVSFDEPRCVFKDCDGASSRQVWAVIGQTVDESGSEPGIINKLCFVRHEVEE